MRLGLEEGHNPLILLIHGLFIRWQAQEWSLVPRHAVGRQAKNGALPAPAAIDFEFSELFCSNRTRAFSNHFERLGAFSHGN